MVHLDPQPSRPLVPSFFLKRQGQGQHVIKVARATRLTNLESKMVDFFAFINQSVLGSWFNICTIPYHSNSASKMWPAGTSGNFEDKLGLTYRFFCCCCKKGV